MSDDKFDVIKHSAAIHISNTLSLVERKITNALLKNAYNDLRTKPVHEINISKLSSLIGWEQGNADNEIKDALKKLVETKVELNILGKDKKREWGITTLLAEAKIKEGLCSYAYSPMLQELLYNPNIYARLDLQVQRNFRSKYSLALWEFLVDILGSAKKQEIESDWVLVKDIRKLLDATEAYYDQFFQFNQKIIKTAISEINRESDLHVSVNYLRESRKVVALSFWIKKKDYSHSLSVSDKEGIDNNEDVSVGNDTSAEEKNEAVERLFMRLKNEFKVSTRTAKRLLSTYSVDDIENDLLVLSNTYLKNAKKVNNLAALTVRAIEDHYGEQIVFDNISSQDIIKEDQDREKHITHIGWKNVRGKLKEIYGEAAFRSWLSKIEFVQIRDECVYLGAPTKFIRSWIEEHYIDKIREFWQQEDNNITHVSLLESVHR